ncbi:MAG: class I SAM-dependent methyltransferase [Jatrophihabitans sp.]
MACTTPQHTHPEHDHAGPDAAAEAAFAELLELDGQVLRGYWTQALTWVRQAATDNRRRQAPTDNRRRQAPTDHRRILDLGAGSGVGTIALAQRFGGAEVIAVDASEQLLKRIRVKALDLGLADRVRTVQVDLDHAWPAVGPIDITWASMSLHHLADPDRALREVFAATRPGGLIAVAELGEPLRFLPHELGFGRPGLEERCLEALGRQHADLLPELGTCWAARLEAAGFTLLGERTLTIEQDPPHPAGTGRYAQLWLDRMRSGLAGRLAADDLAALTTLLDGTGPLSLRGRADLRLRGARTVTLARRP